jgi:hypothetical protein
MVSNHHHRICGLDFLLKLVKTCVIVSDNQDDEEPMTDSVKRMYS